MTTERFYAKIWKTGDSFVTTVPSNIIRHSDLGAGDLVVITLKKEVLKSENDKKVSSIPEA